MTTIVCVAHPDDEAIGPGGTIAKLSQEEDVIVVCFSYGQSWPFWKNEQEVIKMRVRESRLAGEILGIKEKFFLGMNDGNIEQEYDVKKRETLKGIFQKYKPDKVFFHSIQDAHPDHLAVNKAVNEIISKMKIDVYTFEINLWNWFQQKTPRVVFDVSDVWVRKVRAMNQFKSQKLFVKPFGALVTLKAYYYGKKIGSKYAEVFYKR